MPGAELTAEERQALFAAAVEAVPGLELKGKAMLYTSLNGNMFTVMNKGGPLGIRLSAEERRQFIGEHDAAIHESHGSQMKEYVTVPDALLSDTQAVAGYLIRSRAYAETLKPKATKR